MQNLNNESYRIQKIYIYFNHTAPTESVGYLVTIVTQMDALRFDNYILVLPSLFSSVS